MEGGVGRGGGQREGAGGGGGSGGISRRLLRVPNALRLASLGKFQRDVMQARAPEPFLCVTWQPLGTVNSTDNAVVHNLTLCYTSAAPPPAIHIHASRNP